ncbi:hypothetical protein [Sphingosinicella rhizophila]|uniref:Transcriptional regulator n=1 Tax=Sphingosinicella rhizophila TaxID=3050082 RepID=A0ABU3QAW3_9SPHN|nr:hypothetical protein [Sphingosinicella sp. GR2756]MDT9600085.1 hypothetical protein [Sphingosinicella sp. GR2756]
MSSNDENIYHQRRAREEMDLGYRADHRCAAESHFRLASLHMQRIAAGAGVSADVQEMLVGT